MSLRVWLPFVKDLYNQGMNDLEPSIASTQGSITTGGKLGSCFKTTTSGNIILNYSPNINTGSLSFGGWFKFNKAEIQTALSTKTYTSSATAATGNLLGNDSYGGVGLIWGSNNMYSSGKELTAITIFSHIRTATVNASTSSFSITFDEWVNVYFVWDYSDRTLKFYVNGSLFNTKTFADFTDAKVESLMCNRQSIYSGKGPSASIPFFTNDIRIYDHALSVKEIKEIAKGLACHYKLADCSGDANPNRLNLIPKSYSPTAYNAYQFNMTENLVAGETYTIQLWDVDVSHSAKSASNLGVWVYWGGGSVSLLSWSGTSYFTDGHADYLVKTFTVTASQAGGSGATNLWLNIYNSVSYVAGTMDMTIGRWKLEKGSTATAYAHTVDEMGGEDTTIYDSSGYNYHMTAYGSPTISTNTVRNSVSTHFINGQYALAQANANTYLPKDAITVNLWMNCSTWGNPISCTEGGGWNFESASAGIQFPCYISGVGYKVANSGIAASTLLNAWHMLTGVFDGTSVKIYIDAELKATTATESTNGIGYAANRLVISGEAGGATPASSTFVGEISDVRIFATALSAEDIKALYQVGASIDKDGNMYAYEFNEV